MEEEKYKLIKQIACGVLFTTAAAIGALYAYRIIREGDGVNRAYSQVKQDASGIAKEYWAAAVEQNKGSYDAAKNLAKDPVGAVKEDINALEDAVKGQKSE